MREDMITFNGQAVIVTGAGRGMGREHALLFAKRGAKVVVADNGVSRQGDGTEMGPAASVADEIKAAGGDAIAYTESLAVEAGAAGVVQACIGAFGRVDAIVHNAGIAPDLRPIGELSTDALDKLLKLGAYSPFWMARAAWPYFIEQGRGRIVAVASHAIFGHPGGSGYSASKTAMIGFGRSIAGEGASNNIYTNVVAPTAWTRLTAASHSGSDAEFWEATYRPEKVSPVIAFLCSDECEINGEILSVGGGRISRIVFAEGQGVVIDDISVEKVRDSMQEVMSKEVSIVTDMRARRQRINKELSSIGRAEDRAVST